MNIKTFKQLRNLIIRDQVKKLAPVEFKNYYLDEWSGIVSPVELVEKLDDFENVKGPTSVSERERMESFGSLHANSKERIGRNGKTDNRRFSRKMIGNRKMKRGVEG